MDVVIGTKINQLLSTVDPNGLLFSEWMKSKGYSDQLLKRYRESNWLSSLSKGVMYRTGSNITAFSALSSYNSQLNKHVRIAAHSALEYWGFNHYVPMGKPVLSIALKAGEKTPAWMTSDIFDMTFRPFTTKIFPMPDTNKVEREYGYLYISSPEQAILECLLLAPERYSYLDVYYLMEQLTTLRSEVLQSLLQTCTNIRVKRLFLFMAEKASHYWMEELDLERIDTGSSKMQFAQNGVYNAKYKMTIPKELDTYEG